MVDGANSNSKKVDSNDLLLRFVSVALFVISKSYISFTGVRTHDLPHPRPRALINGSALDRSTTVGRLGGISFLISAKVSTKRPFLCSFLCRLQ